MQPNQQSFINRLLSTLEKEPSLQSVCMEKVRKGTLNRVFDDVPDLLSADELKEYTQQFKQVFAQIRVVPQTQSINPNTFLNEHERTLLLNWERTIVEQAFATLLSPEGKISPAFIAVMGWEESALQPQLHRGELLCAYVGAVHQAITCQPAFMALIEDNPSAASAVFSFINSHYGDLVKKQLSTMGHASAEEKITLRTLLEFPKKHPETTQAIAFGVAVGILSGVTAIGMALFSDKSTNNSASNTTPKPKPNQRGYQP